VSQGALKTPIDIDAYQRGRSCQILIADDDSTTLAALKFLLDREGHQATCVDNGKACIEEAKSRNYDMILVDVHMPGIDGLKVLAELKRNAQTTHTPVIMITKTPSADLIRQCSDIGASDVVRKSTFNIDSLRQIVSRAIPAKGGPSRLTKLPEDRGDAREDFTSRIDALPTYSDKETIATIQQVELPHLFAGIQQEVAFSAESDLDELLWTIHQDPPLLIAVLRDAMQHTSSQKCLRTMVEVLTIDRVRQIAKSLNSLPVAPGNRLWAHRWWRHAIAVGQIARAMSKSTCIDPDQASVAGVMHDIGRLLLLCSNLGDTAVEVYDLARNMALPTTQAEHSVFGMDHKQIGAHFCQTMQLPSWIADVCLWHDAGENIPKHIVGSQRLLCELITSANNIAKSLGYGSLANEELTPTPSSLIHSANQNLQDIEAAIAQVNIACRWRMGDQAPPSRLKTVDATGMRIAFLSTDPGPLNPYRKALAQAGATVTTFDHASRAGVDGTPIQAIILDHTLCSIQDSIPSIRSIAQAYRNVPILLLARRSEDPQHRLLAEGLNVNVYPTPIRANTLLQVVRQISRDANGDKA